jgi:hypothetical protein
MNKALKYSASTRQEDLTKKNSYLSNPPTALPTDTPKRDIWQRRISVEI